MIREAGARPPRAKKAAGELAVATALGPFSDVP